MFLVTVKQVMLLITQLDASWIILFETNGEKYTVTARGLRYIP